MKASFASPSVSEEASTEPATAHPVLRRGNCLELSVAISGLEEGGRVVKFLVIYTQEGGGLWLHRVSQRGL